MTNHADARRRQYECMDAAETLRHHFAGRFDRSRVMVLYLLDACVADTPKEQVELIEKIGELAGEQD